MASEQNKTKAEWRKQALANRQALSVDNERICAHLGRFLGTTAPEGWVVAYDALPGEVDLGALVDASSPVRPFALTRTPETGRDLTIHPASSALEQHRYGYRQPVEGAPLVPDAEIVAVLVPALAFDHLGHRLGFGAGYYDRFLARLAPSVLRVGVSDGFIVSELPVEPHDIAMTHIAHEVGVVPAPW